MRQCATLSSSTLPMRPSLRNATTKHAPEHAPEPDRRFRWAVAMLVVYCLGVLPSLGQSLLETHAHRQTQTALTAVLYAEGEIDLFRPPLPILGPPGSIPQEFPIFQAMGAMVMRAGVPADTAMRLVGLATFLVAAWLVYLLARRLMGSTASLIALAAFLFNPHAWVYGRTSLIEYLAVAGGVGFLYLASRWMDRARPVEWLAAAGFGALGILAKITTGGFFLLPVLLWRSPEGRWGFQRLGVWAMVILALGVGGVWSIHAQGVREETPASAFLSLQNQLEWFFGLASQRLELSTWRVPLVAMLALTGFGLALWAPLAVARARSGSQPHFLIAFLGLVVAMPLILINLYAIHDYYWAAVAPMIAIGVGLGSEWLAERLNRRWVRRATVGLAGAWIATIVGMAPTWTIIYGTPTEEADAMRIATFVQEHSAPDDWVVLEGWGWNPTFFYYADRRGLAVPGPDPNLDPGQFGRQDISEIDIERITSDPVFGPFITCDHQANCTVTEPR